MSPKYSVSIVAWNKREITEKCIDSVLAAGSDFEMILTNNGSEESVGQYFDDLAAKYPGRVQVVHNKENKGFSEPQNHALTLARGEYFVCLNNDTEVPANWLEMLQEPFLRNPNAALVGPSETCCEIKDPFPSWHGSPGPKLEYIEGSCLMIPTALARKCGLFAPYLKFAYGEDSDLSLRMQARGMTIHQAPFTIKHLRGQTSIHVHGIYDIQMANSKALTQRWENWHVYRRFDLPVVIQRDEALGDVLLTTPLIRHIRDQQPRSEIYYETAVPQVLKGNPHVKLGEPFEKFEHLYKWARTINLNMAYENLLGKHIVDAYFETAMIIPTEPDYRRTENYVITPETRDLANASLKGTRWVAVCPGFSSWPGKQWGKFYDLCYWLQDQGYRVLLLGLQDRERSYPCYLDRRGSTTIPQAAALIQKCDFFIGIDSYLMHVAESLNVPTLGLFGVSSPCYIMTKPSSIGLQGKAPCAGERHREIGKRQMLCGGECINSLSLKQVVTAFQQLVNK